jgi:hypothetical protein
MIKNKTISVIITTHESRYQSARELIDPWLLQPIDELILIDGTGKFPSNWISPKAKLDPRFNVIRVFKDFGTKTDYAIALLTIGDMICLADDDVLALPGFTEDLFKGYQQARLRMRSRCVVGIIGRTFHGTPYWGNTKFYRSSKVTQITRTGFVGCVYFTEREEFGFDVRGCPRNCDDLWWQMKVRHATPKFVVPTTRYKNLPSASEDSAMYKSPALKKQREKFYKEYYDAIYRPTGRTY